MVDDATTITDAEPLDAEIVTGEDGPAEAAKLASPAPDDQPEADTPAEDAEALAAALPDPRRNAYRPDLADAALRGTFEAAQYVTGEIRHVIAPSVALRRTPDEDAPLETEALRGEMLHVFEFARGWAWCQLGRDRYVGYLREDALRRGPALTGHRIAVPRTFVFPRPDIKSRPTAALYLGSALKISGQEGDFVKLPEGGFVFARHVVHARTTAPDYVDVAGQFIGVPYLWGGKTALGIDCSGLVQVALDAAGIACPRDSDMQCAEVGEPPEDPTRLERGDLIFWTGHVGIMLDGSRLLHANAHHMMVAIEHLDVAAERIREATGDGIIAVKRIPGLLA